MAAFIFVFVDPGIELPFSCRAGQLVDVIRQPNIAHCREHQFDHTDHPSSLVETWSRGDEYSHLFALDERFRLGFTDFAGPDGFGGGTSSGFAGWVVVQVPELGANADLPCACQRCGRRFR